MNKKFILGLVVFFSLAFINEAFPKDCPAYATACGTPKVYQLTMNKLEVSTTGSATDATTIVSTPTAFDIASASAGVQVGSWFSGANLPPGTYNWMRRTISRSFSIQGYVTSGGVDYYTSNAPDTSTFGPDTNINSVSTGTYSFTGSDVPSDYAAVTYTADDPSDHGITLPAGISFTSDSIVEIDTSSPMTVELGKTMTMQITFNVTNTIELQPYDGSNPGYLKMSCSEPDVSATVTTE